MSFWDRFRPAPPTPRRLVWENDRLVTDSAQQSTIYGANAGVPNQGYGLTWNPATAQGSERDPLEIEQIRVWWQNPSREQLETLMRLSGVTRRVVDLIPAWCTLYAEESWHLRDQTAAARPLFAAGARLGIADKVAKTWRVAREHGNAAFWMLCDEGGRFNLDRQKEPLDFRAVTRIRDLYTLAKYEMWPIQYQTAMGEPIPYGAPLVFQCLLYRLGVPSVSIQIHASRLIMFRGTPLDAVPTIPPSWGWGDDSVILTAMLSILSHARARRGRDRAADSFMRTIFKIYLPEGGTPEELLQRLQARWSIFRFFGSLGAFLIAKGDGKDPGEDAIQLDAPLQGLTNLSDAAIDDICMDTGTAKMLLKGTDAGGLGRTETLRQTGWIGKIDHERGSTLTPRLRQFYDVLYACNGIYRPDYEIIYPSVEVPTAAEAAKIRVDLLAGDRALIDMGALSPRTVYRSRVEEGWQDELQPAIEGEEPDFLPLGTAPSTKPLGPTPPGEPAQMPEPPQDAGGHGEEMAAALNAAGARQCGHFLTNLCPACQVRGLRIPLVGPDRKQLMGKNGRGLYRVEWRPIGTVETPRRA